MISRSNCEGISMIVRFSSGNSCQRQSYKKAKAILVLKKPSPISNQFWKYQSNWSYGLIFIYALMKILLQQKWHDLLMQKLFRSKNISLTASLIFINISHLLWFIKKFISILFIVMTFNCSFVECSNKVPHTFHSSIEYGTFTLFFSTKTFVSIDNGSFISPAILRR